MEEITVSQRSYESTFACPIEESYNESTSPLYDLLCLFGALLQNNDVLLVEEQISELAYHLNDGKQQTALMMR